MVPRQNERRERSLDLRDPLRGGRGHQGPPRVLLRSGRYDRNPVLRAGQPHQVGIFERLIRSGQRPPPHTEPARGMAHAEVRVQNNAIDAIVATAQQILIESAQPVRHGRQVTGTLPQLQTAPKGPLFRSPVCEKA